MCESITPTRSGTSSQSTTGTASTTPLGVFKEPVQSLSDKLNVKLSLMMAALEDKMDAVRTIPPLLQQMSAMEADLKKIPLLGNAVRAVAKWDFEGLKTAMTAMKQTVETAWTDTRDAMAKNLKEALAANLKQILERFSGARETAADHYAKLQASHAEGTAVLKSLTALLTAFRAKLAELDEVMTNYKKHIDEVYWAVQSMAEQVAELHYGQTRCWIAWRP